MLANLTIEKMIFLLIERLKSGGISEETEVQVAFGGHELAQRKGFESIINHWSIDSILIHFDNHSHVTSKNKYSTIF